MPTNPGKMIIIGSLGIFGCKKSPVRQAILVNFKLLPRVGASASHPI